MEPWQIGVIVGGFLGNLVGGVAAVKVGLNGTKESVHRIETKVDKVIDKVADHDTRIAVLEAAE